MPSESSSIRLKDEQSQRNTYATQYASIGSHVHAIGPPTSVVPLMSVPSLRHESLRDSAHNRTSGHARIVPDSQDALHPASYFRVCDSRGAPRCLAAGYTSLCRLSFWSPRYLDDGKIHRYLRCGFLLIRSVRSTNDDIFFSL